MTGSNIKLIFMRELRDQLRDRRTLFMIIVLPLLLYPSIGIGLLQFTLLFGEQPRVVAVRGTEHLPAHPPMFVQVEPEERGEPPRVSFVPQLFEVEKEALQLEIVEAQDDETARRMLESGEVHVLLQIPATLRDELEEGHDFRFELSYKSANEKSRAAYLSLKEALENWKRLTIQQRLESRGLPRDFANPYAVEVLDIATPQQVASGLIWAKLFPFLLVVMSLTGAFYPAVDLCAGEKERGTIETLLISPAARSEIVLGKFFTVFLFSVGTAILNLLSMATTGWVMTRQANAAPPGAPMGMFAPPSPTDAGWILLLLLPLAAFFSALGIALAAFARSTKEGQYYLTPLFLVTMPLVLVTVVPGIELNGFNSVIPVTGAALLLKTLIQGHYDLALQYFVPVILPTMLYAVLSLRWAIDQFSREEVLFREAERLDLVLWARHLFRDKEPYPSAAEAVFCFCLMILLVWFLGGFLTPAPADSDAARQAGLQRSLIVMQVAFVATPSIIMALMLTTSVRKTLLLCRPKWNYIAVAMLLALALHPIMVELTQYIHRGLTQPKWVTDQIRELLGSRQPLWWQMGLIALLPAVCEEIAFRGFILSGLMRRMSPSTAIVLSAFLFGFFHINPQQLLPATLLGCVLGLIATRSGSLLPGMIFHFMNNSLALCMANLQDRLEQASLRNEPGGWLFDLFQVLYRQTTPQVFSYQAPYSVAVLALSAIVATVVLTWLLKQPVRAPAAQDGDGVGLASGPNQGKGSGLVKAGIARLSATRLGLSREARDATS